jgi:hypothetical protein
MSHKLPRILHPRFIDETLERAPKGATTLHALYCIPEGENVRVIEDWNCLLRPQDKAS